MPRKYNRKTSLFSTRSCIHCSELDTLNMVQCDGCNKWVHLTCDTLVAKLTKAQADSLKNYKCQKCRDDKKAKSKTRKSATPEATSDTIRSRLRSMATPVSSTQAATTRPKRAALRVSFNLTNVEQSSSSSGLESSEVVVNDSHQSKRTTTRASLGDTRERSVSNNKVSDRMRKQSTRVANNKQDAQSAGAAAIAAAAAAAAEQEKTESRNDDSSTSDNLVLPIVESNSTQDENSPSSSSTTTEILDSTSSSEIDQPSDLGPQDPGADYEVESILAMRRVGSVRKFRIKFTVWPKAEWVEEKNLVGCYDKLKKFLSDNQYSPTKMLRKVGAVMRPEVRYNSDNFVSLEEILHQAQVYSSSKSFTRKINVIIHNGQPLMSDTILLLRVETHCAVALCLINSGIAYVADGANAIIHDSMFKLLVKEQLNMKIKGLKFLQQTKVDHCASSAAAMIIEFMRLYQNPAQIDDYIRVEPWALNKIRKTLYKEPSENERKGRIGFDQLRTPTCNVCGRQFKSGRLALVTHMRLCHLD